MRYLFTILVFLFVSCKHSSDGANIVQRTSISQTFADSVTIPISRDSALADKIVSFAKAQIGTPYRYGCAAPATGFDCSGFVSYVFDHFNISVPRSSVEFTDKGTEVLLKDARPADLILFTGTNSKIRVVGHIGIIVDNDTSGIHFIHSSSGKEEAVTITKLNDRYRERFVKVIRLVP